VRGIGWSILRTLGSRGMSTVVFIVLARLLDPTAFGLVALGSVFVALMQVFVDQGFSQALIQRHDLEAAHLHSAFWASLATGALAAGVGIAGADFVSQLLGEPRLAPVLRVLSLGLLLSGISSIPEAILTRRLAFRSLAIRKLLATAAGGVAGVVAAIAGLGVWSLVTQILVQGAVGAVVLWTTVSWRPRLRFSPRHFWEIFSFGLNVVLVTLLNFLNRRADDLLIGAFLGARALGVYSIAYRLLLLLTDVLTRTIDAVAFPLFARVQTQPERMTRGYLMATQVSTTVAAPVFLAMAALAPDVIPLAFGAQWQAATTVMQILSFIGVLHSSLFFNNTVLLAAGHARRVVGLTAVNAFSNVVAFAIAVHWGIAAVAAAYVILGYLLSPLPVLMARRVVRFDLRDYGRRIAVPFLSGGVMVAAIALFRATLGSQLEPVLSVCASVAIGAVVYPLTLWLASPRFARELWSYVAPGVPGVRRLAVAIPWR
jgi:PST family polysaccharide transporter